jgi:alpha-ketoglutarate-dependent taurine dioxygenase
MDFENLYREGWQIFDGVTDNEALHTIGASLGKLIADPFGRMLAVLRPSHPNEVVTRSFSFKYGYGAFPLHTDTAFWASPVRYIVFRSMAPSLTPTVILPRQATELLFSGVESDRAVFWLRTTAGTRYAKVRLEEPETGYRFDLNNMRAANDDAKRLVARVAKTAASEQVEIPWTGQNAVVIDNWRCLHGRGEVAPRDSNRALTRLYVDKE